MDRDCPKISLSKWTWAVAILVTLPFGGGKAQAYDNWTGASTGNFSNAANWTGGNGSPNAVPTSGEQITFLNGTTFSLTNDLTAATFGGIFLNSPTSVTISGTDFSLSNANGNPIQINSTATLTINDNVTLTSASENFISTSGASGTIILNGNIAGSSTTVVAGSGNALNLSFNNDTVTLAGLTYEGNSGISSAYSTNPSAIINNSNFTVNGNVSDQRGNLTFKGTTVANITGSINNSTGDWGSLVIQDSANVAVGSINMAATTNTGQIVLEGGTLTTGSIQAIDWELPGNLMSLLVFNGTQVNSSASSAAFVSVTPSALTGVAGSTGANVAYVGTGGLLLNTAGFNDTITSSLANLTTTQTSADSALTAGMAGPGAVTKSGTGTLTLTGANTYSGGTVISGGTLKLGNATALGTSTGVVNVSAGASLDLAGTTPSDNNPLTLNGTGDNGGGALTNSGSAATYGGVVTLGSSGVAVGGTGAITLSNGTITGSGDNLTLQGAGGTVSSVIGTGAGTVNVNSTGAWTLANANTSTGNTTVTAGTLNLTGSVAGSLTVGGSGAALTCAT